MLPPVGLSLIQMRPPCASATRRQKVKPKPGAAPRAAAPANLNEAVEQHQLILVGDTGSGVDHVDADETRRRAFRARFVSAHDDGALRRTELERVIDQIEQHPLDLVAVYVEQRQIGVVSRR